MAMVVRGVIFDMDGTLTTPYLDFAAMKAQANVGDRDLLEYLDTETGPERDRVHRLLLELEADGAARAELNPGAREVVEGLTARGVPTGLLTRNSRQSVDTICEKYGLQFDQVITREDRPYKPAPEPIWLMAERWSLPAPQVLMVGDYKWDVMCAKNAGCASAVLLNGDGVPEWAAEADLLIHDLNQVLALTGEPS